ncbi:MAG: hypothetical protein Kow001_00640 [Acidobacteriota bacterium]
MSETQKLDPDRSAAHADPSSNAAGFPAKKNPYHRPLLTRTDLRHALSGGGAPKDAVYDYGYAS